MQKQISLHSQKLTQWHFSIASFFESSKYLHQIGLYAMLPKADYGLLGTLFSLAYLSANLCTLEISTAILTSLRDYKKKNLYASLILTIIIKPIIQHSIGALCVIAYIHYKAPLALACATGSIAFTEGMRITIRPLLYASSTNTRIAQGEAVLSFLYILSMWACIVVSPEYITPTFLVSWYAFASALGLSYLIIKGIPLLKTYQKSVAHLPRAQLTGVSITQQHLIILHLPHHLFSANFLVPFFAHNISLNLAGVLKITSELASAVKSILKSSLSFPLHTIMLSYADHTHDITNTFAQSMNKLIPRATKFLAGFILIGSCSAVLRRLLIGPLLPTSLLIFIGFCILTTTDYLCMPYELLSMYRNKIFTAAIIRGVEVLCSTVIILICTESPLFIICSIASIRFLAWRVLAYETTSAQPSFLQD